MSRPTTSIPVPALCAETARRAEGVRCGLVRRLARGVSVAALVSAADAALAQHAAAPQSLVLGLQSVFGSALVMGLLVFTTTLAIFSVRDRRVWSDRDRESAVEIARLREVEDRTKILLGSERQVLVLWNEADAPPSVEGDPTLLDESGNARRVLAFGSWLKPADASRIEALIARLRERGEGFRISLRTAKDRFIEAEGRAVGGRAVLRLRDVSDDRAALLRVEAEAAATRRERDALRCLLESISQPVWLRDGEGRLAWVNAAYRAAVEAGAPQAKGEGTDALAELLDRPDRDEAASNRRQGKPYRNRVTAVMAGSRRTLEVAEMPLSDLADPAAIRTGGIVRDVSEAETMRAELARQAEAHRRVLDDMPIAVASFDGRQRLVFHNAAYRQLWSLPHAFLDSTPSEGEILDRLRAEGRLPEQADFRKWKESLLEAYRSAESSETWWHLPDRRTLRVVTSPNPQGGITYLFDDVSDRMDLESRVNALISTQRETLDTLAEGVALFGQDGRLKLSNRAFAELWRLTPEIVERSPHIDIVVELGRRLAPEDGPWDDITSAVSGLSDRRERQAMRMARVDDKVIDAAVEPLPGGATLVTCADVTAQANQERVLKERNEALELAARLRNGFVHHVSYELRSPLTNIIGFTELLGEETVGPLNERQREYAGHIMRSSGTLLAIINDILDLASIDTETIELDRERVDIRETIETAAEGIKDRLVESDLRLEIDVPASIGGFIGDRKRVRQVIYNLLSNAAGFSSPGQTIRVAARKDDGSVVVSVVDQGRGIPPEVQDRVFDRFETDSAGTKHRGVGLGLSIVRSFVELHGGHVELVSEKDAGTTVTCYFPADQGEPTKQLAASIPTIDDSETDPS
ncbi:PAS domain-containing sensor histidine kinase [Enterovirga rhinocerotis]|uniref:histidine kinase n=1 Tax=Enterovirga rhinocerotis TaxID=1339210 RepID=A0A4V3DX44_9HYPH|nr:PAS domain-containing sensor histidine kinase [Enterovirga rhinocerotis]TDR87339.1 PAS domain-containing protein [Enterovirga rhinocerotis]